MIKSFYAVLDLKNPDLVIQKIDPVNFKLYRKWKNGVEEWITFYYLADGKRILIKEYKNSTGYEFKIDTENKEFKEIRTKVMEGKVDAQNPWNTSQIKKWLECTPVELEKYRLEKYFYLTRENLKRSSIDESGFSKNTKEILERIGRAKSGQMVAIIKDMEKLRAEEIADTFKVVV